MAAISRLTLGARIVLWGYGLLATGVDGCLYAAVSDSYRLVV